MSLPLNKILACVVLSGLSSIVNAETKQNYPWLDSMHAGLVDSVDSTAIWFDDFFSLEEFPKDKAAKGEARIRLGWEPRSRDLNEFETRFKVRFKLPKLKNRVDLVMSDYDDEQADNSLNVLQNESYSEANRFSLALRWKSNPSSGFSHRVGVGRKLQAFVKSRYRNSHQLSSKTTFRWETAGYFYSKDGLGAEVTSQIGYNMSDTDLFRLNTHFYYRDKTNDWFWQHNWQNLKQLDTDTALISGIYLEGLSQPNYRIEEYLISTRWRKNAFREWLFFELEPFVMWRRDEHFSASYGMAFRVEGHFSRY